MVGLVFGERGFKPGVRLQTCAATQPEENNEIDIEEAKPANSWKSGFHGHLTLHTTYNYPTDNLPKPCWFACAYGYAPGAQRNTKKKSFRIAQFLRFKILLEISDLSILEFILPQPFVKPKLTNFTSIKNVHCLMDNFTEIFLSPWYENNPCLICRIQSNISPQITGLNY